MAGAMIALAVGLLTPIGAVLLRPLEDRFPQPSADMPSPAGSSYLAAPWKRQNRKRVGRSTWTPRPPG